MPIPEEQKVDIPAEPTTTDITHPTPTTPTESLSEHTPVTSTEPESAASTNSAESSNS